MPSVITRDFITSSGIRRGRAVLAQPRPAAPDPWAGLSLRRHCPGWAGPRVAEQLALAAARRLCADPRHRLALAAWAAVCAAEVTDG